MLKKGALVRFMGKNASMTGISDRTDAGGESLMTRRIVPSVILYQICSLTAHRLIRALRGRVGCILVGSHLRDRLVGGTDLIGSPQSVRHGLRCPSVMCAALKRELAAAKANPVMTASTFEFIAF
jgi:hypothetical protein